MRSKTFWSRSGCEVKEMRLCPPLMYMHASVEHDPVSGSRSNRILQFRTESGLDWILKKTQPDQIWISKLH